MKSVLGDRPEPEVDGFPVASNGGLRSEGETDLESVDAPHTVCCLEAHRVVGVAGVVGDEFAPIQGGEVCYGVEGVDAYVVLDLVQAVFLDVAGYPVADIDCEHIEVVGRHCCWGVVSEELVVHLNSEVEVVARVPHRHRKAHGGW